MKKLSIFLVLLTILGIFVLTNIVFAQQGYTAPPCGMPLLEGCIGACGAPYLQDFVVPENGAYCFTTTYSSLCPNTGAEVIIYVNGRERFRRDMTNGVSIAIGAKEGDVITIEGNLFPIDNGIICVWLGMLNFKLGRIEGKVH